MPEEIKLSIEVGRLDGKVGALEDRFNRFENAIEHHLERMDTKLDTLLTAHAAKGGESASRTKLTQFAMWAFGAALAALSMFNTYMSAHH